MSHRSGPSLGSSLSLVARPGLNKTSRLFRLRPMDLLNPHTSYNPAKPANWIEGDVCGKCQVLLGEIKACLEQGVEPHTFKKHHHWQHLKALFISTTRGCHLCSLIFGAALPLQGARANEISSIFEESEDCKSALIALDRVYELDQHTSYTISIKRAHSDFAQVGGILWDLGGPKDAELELVVEGLPVVNMLYVMPVDRAVASPGILAGCQASEMAPKRPLCSSTRDLDALNLARWWLKTCIAEHDECSMIKPSIPNSTHPARLLRLNIKSAAGGLQLVEVKDLPSTPTYLTLSYVWGGQNPVRLELSSLEKMKAGIELTSLPRTIRDALEVTKALGCEYLWVDSLCIIQDSATDWATESAKMGSIYRQSLLTIGALWASSSQEGLFRERNPFYDRSLPVRGTNFEITNTSNLGLAEYESPRAPLQTRAWVMQERVMARRTLFFGSNSLFWECARCHACEADVLGVRTRSSDDPTTPTNFKAAVNEILGHNTSGNPQPPLLGLLSSWSAIRSYYTDCHLTYEKDRPIAISGLMNFLAGATSLQHAHGIWLDMVARELCWKASTIGYRASHYEAPSWSWLSAIAPISDAIKLGKYSIRAERTSMLVAGPELNGPIHPSMDSEQGRLFLQGRPKGCLTLVVRAMWRVQLLPEQRLRRLRPIGANEQEGDESLRPTFTSGEPITRWYQDVILDPLPTEAIWIDIAHYEVDDGRTGNVGIVAVNTGRGLERIGIKKFTSREFHNKEGRKIHEHGKPGKGFVPYPDSLIQPHILVNLV